MKIGIDLDNTLINYDSAFLLGAAELGLTGPDWHGDKYQTRERIRSSNYGEIKWQILQGQVYGRLIGHAKIFSGVYRFLWRCRQRGITVDLVSHKTEFGHRDVNKVPLRIVAIDFLAKHGITVGRNNLVNYLFFESTREEKIRRIAENDYDWFIDDLPELLLDPGLPQSLGKILFSNDKHNLGVRNYSSWTEIDRYLLGDWAAQELLALAETVVSAPVASVNWLSGGGNSRLLKVLSQGADLYVLKLYPDESTHDRLSSEFCSFKLIRENHGGSVPRPGQRHSNLNAATYEWIHGTVVKQPTIEHVQQALKFIEYLHNLRGLSDFQSFQNASAAFVSGLDFENQLRARFNNLMEFVPVYLELTEYLKSEFLPVMEHVVQWVRDNWKIEPSYGSPILRQHQTLSPSDFGFHNSIESSEGKLSFIDFEYFGWDDPVKLIVDFYFHPGMVLGSEMKSLWIRGTKKIYGEDITERLRLSWPLIALSWCLILLNEYRADVWMRRCAANSQKSIFREEILKSQLSRSRALLEKIASSYSQPIFN